MNSGKTVALFLDLTGDLYALAPHVIIAWADFSLVVEQKCKMCIPSHLAALMSTHSIYGTDPGERAAWGSYVLILHSSFIANPAGKGKVAPIPSCMIPSAQGAPPPAAFGLFDTMGLPSSGILVPTTD